MSQIHQLNNPKPSEIQIPDDEDIAQIFEEWLAQKEFGDDGGPPPSQPPTYYRHQLANPDFWFIFASGVCLFLIFTSFIHVQSFELLAAIAFMFNIFALISNLTREKQGIIVHEVKHQVVIRLPRWLGFGYIPTKNPIMGQPQF